MRGPVFASPTGWKQKHTELYKNLINGRERGKTRDRRFARLVGRNCDKESLSHPFYAYRRPRSDGILHLISYIFPAFMLLSMPDW